MRNIKFTLIISLIFVLNQAMAQQQPIYNQYAMNPFVLNPAYAGHNEMINLTASYRQQWAAIDGAPTTMTFTGHAALNDLKSGVGLSVWSDKIGKISQTSVSGAYSYKVKFEWGTLAGGLSLGMVQMKTDYASSNLNGVIDPTFTGGDINQWKFNAGAGLFLTGDKYFVGFSVPQMLGNQFSNESNVEQIKLAQQYYLTGGYVFDLGESKFDLKPYAMIRMEGGTPFNYDINLQAYYNEQFSLGVQYKSTNSTAVLLELILQKSFYIGYSYEFNYGTNYEGINTSGSHEFVLTYMLPWKKGDDTAEAKMKFF